jgi:hypothetical protein
LDDEWLSEDFYAQVIVISVDHAPLFAAPRLARCMAATLRALIPTAPGCLWGYTVLPDNVRLIVGPTQDAPLEAFIETVKQATSAALLDVMRRMDNDALDLVLRYSPVWGGAIYQVWQSGSHRAVFWTEYKLSNALYELRQAPVVAGLAARAEDWPYTWIGGEAL